MGDGKTPWVTSLDHGAGVRMSDSLRFKARMTPLLQSSRKLKEPPGGRYIGTLTEASWNEWIQKSAGLCSFDEGHSSEWKVGT